MSAAVQRREEAWGKDADGNIEPYRLAHALRIRGEDWADKNAAAEMLEKTEKSVLAQITNDIRESRGGSRKECEDVALASQAYRDHLGARVEARRVANIAKVQYEAIQVLIEAMRTAEATKRAEMVLGR